MMREDERDAGSEYSGNYNSDANAVDPQGGEMPGQDLERDPDQPCADERRREHRKRDYDRSRDDYDTNHSRGHDRDGDRHRDRERDRARGKDRYSDRGRDRDSPEYRRKRRANDRSDDEYDDENSEQDYGRGQDEESRVIVLQGLLSDVTEDDIFSALGELEGPQPLDLRLIKREGISRGFAFMEFYHLQDSTRWMETNQNKLVIKGKSVTALYSYRRQKFDNWLCGSCGMYNFRKRLMCFRCGSSKADEESGASGSYTERSGGFLLDTLILRNVAPYSTVNGILNILSPFSNLSSGNIRLIKDKMTGQNRGFAFVQLISPLEASQLLAVLQELQPPLQLDEKVLTVEYAKSGRKDSSQTDVVKPNTHTAASLAIAAAQWSSCQLRQGSTSSYNTALPQSVQGYEGWQQQQLKGFPASGGNGLLGAAPGSHTAMPSATSGIISQPPQLFMNNQNCQQQQQVVWPVVSEKLPSGSAASTLTTAASGFPDTSAYQYDEKSGYFYDPQTGFFYDASTQYYYNSDTQQFLYWDNEKQNYVPVPANTGSDPAAAVAASTSAAAGLKEAKGKKEKPKSKSAQQIAKDMERWAKNVNKRKEIVKINEQPAEDSEPEDVKDESADAGFYVLEKRLNKMGSFEMVSSAPEPLRIPEPEMPPEKPSQSVQPEAHDAERYFEEAPKERASSSEEKMTDWKNMVCLLCRRQFPNKDGLVRHQQLSDLHKQNLEIHRKATMSEEELEEMEKRELELKYRDRAAERREKYGVPEPPAAAKKKRKFYQPQAPGVDYEQPTKDGLTSDNIGNKMLQAMGWQEGTGLGRHQQGITTPIAAALRVKGTGLGIKGSNYQLTASDSYKDSVRKAMFSRFSDV